jgi:DsbC/DsbD-like thiol-disulfide interchange protein
MFKIVSLLLATGAIVLAAGTSATMAQQGASAWQDSNASRLRLISTGAPSDGVTPSAALQITLDPGFKTYWRNPGEAGVPPLLSHDGSDNVASVEMLFPVPQRIEDESGVSIVYKDGIILPLLVKALDPAKPVRLNLNLQFGVCDKLCIPAEAGVALTLGTVPDAALAKTVAEVIDTLPLRADATAHAALFPLRSTTIDQPEKRRHRIRFVLDGKADAAFGEGPEGWFAEAKFAPAADGAATQVTLDLYGPRKDLTLRPCPVRITLSGTKGAIERTIPLDHCTSQP